MKVTPLRVVGFLTVCVFCWLWSLRFPNGFHPVQEWNAAHEGPATSVIPTPPAEQPAVISRRQALQADAAQRRDALRRMMPPVPMQWSDR